MDSPVVKVQIAVEPLNEKSSVLRLWGWTAKGGHMDRCAVIGPYAPVWAAGLAEAMTALIRQHLEKHGTISEADIDRMHTNFVAVGERRIFPERKDVPEFLWTPMPKT